METLTASEVKQGFGKVLLKVQKSPVTINKNGKPVAVILSANEFEEYKTTRLHLALEKGLDSVAAGRVIDGDKMLESFRQKIKDA